MVDDDDEDIYLTRRAFCAADQNLVFNSVKNKVDFFDYLYCRASFNKLTRTSVPDVILLDVNIPKTGGHEILHSLRADTRFGHLPVVILSTSAAKHDIRRAYELGANSFITKQSSVDGMRKLAEQFCQYWFTCNQLPHD